MSPTNLYLRWIEGSFGAGICFTYFTHLFPVDCNETSFVAEIEVI